MQTHKTLVSSTQPVSGLPSTPTSTPTTHARTQGREVQLASACKELPGEQRVNTDIFKELILEAEETLAKTEESVLAHFKDNAIGWEYFATKLNQAHNCLENNLGTLKKCTAKIGDVTLSPEALAKAKDDVRQAYYSVKDELAEIKRVKRLEGLVQKSLNTNEKKINAAQVEFSKAENTSRFSSFFQKLKWPLVKLSKLTQKP